jgi:co-chaperonin GroES (HSP10)
MLGPNQLPYSVVGERVFLRMDPPKERTEGGLYMPDEAKLRAFSGTVIDAGLIARDKLYDHGLSIGDHVLIARFAGVIEEWDHVIEGPYNLEDEAYEWRRVPTKAGQLTKYQCEKTGAIRVLEPMVVANVDDILGSIDLARRLDAGEMFYERAATEDGRTQHVLSRKE